MAIDKSFGTTRTEQYLAGLCDRTFLKLWSYPNPFRDDGKELCDLIVVFENTVIVFFDREGLQLKQNAKDFGIVWKRWYREVVAKQITSSVGAARYLANRRPLFLDDKKHTPFPIPIDINQTRIFKVIVAHGAMVACRAFSDKNVSGSLAVHYGPLCNVDSDQPFFVGVDRSDPVHIFDSENLEIVLSELDTVYDFIGYLSAKEDAINRHTLLTYCGEEDLVAHYLLNYQPSIQQHIIGTLEDFDSVHIGEGEWADFCKSPEYHRRRSANQISYMWDRLIQITSQNALDGTLTGNGDPFTGRSAIHFMAKEPRFVRRALSERIEKSIANFPESDAPIMRSVSLMPSYFEGTAYVFLQLKVVDKGDYDTEYRPRRTVILEIACAAAKLKWPDLLRVVGIGIDAPKYSSVNSEDLIVMEFDDWSEERMKDYRKANEDFGFFQTGTETRLRITEFPPAIDAAAPV